jgi:hypothetical protein
MKITQTVFTALILIAMFSCNITKKNIPVNKIERMEFTVSKIQNEMDGQIIFLEDDKGQTFTTIISIPNGNFVELKQGDRVSLIAEEIMEMDPPQIISKKIKVLNKKYEKIEEETYWINSRKIEVNGNWGLPTECFQFQEGNSLNKNGKWETLCEEIEYFNYIEGTYYKIKVLKKWHINHENLMDASPFDLELITVEEREDDLTYESPIKTKITTKKTSYKLGEPIELEMEIKNTGEKPYTFLPWGTPIENRFTGSCLKVIYNDKETIDYSGIMVKRVPPTEKDYITLKSDETAQGKVNLFDGYQLDKKGFYTIQFDKDYKGMPASNILKIEIK